ncbi:RteC domain-containing protein [Sphingobacterium thalpophilum]|uniref:RteC protein n=2 Tax=Bacteroidota TaxID=976 RepID=A0A4U9VK10_9SPHI|nr:MULTISPECIES: RteC domain-containing protein [Bacteroidota]OJV51161.1 MAG: tetracycline regulation of excision, RteC [Bacteroidetes bacterium 43-16]AZA85245.1 tetracycline regulation of excision, RteC [Chryseobacterium lactis]AZB07193.1 tetracycline regulation of excision, RteC [Chryseobacterium lactis]MCT3745494.1 RteC domain-containing protein [Elizabethkingia anophelis]MDC8026241.1 RteC domain-containing protein [Elizabethkingia anophelis]
MKYILQNVILEIHKKEDLISSQSKRLIDEAYEMTIYLQDLLFSIKKFIVEEGFKDETEEMHFFRTIKPQVLGKLIYYNKIYRIETTCPVNNGKMGMSYFSIQLANLKREYIEHVCNSDFYRYYRSGRTDRDETYFKRGQINYHDGLNSIVFEIDPSFSTFYDYKVARIISNELLYTYLLTKISPDENPDSILQNSESSKDVFWTDSKNALIELVYALYASGAISHGKIGIRKISLMFQIIFRIPLGDLHHAFHRMKTRAGSRTAFLDQLKTSLEEYMDRDL